MDDVGHKAGLEGDEIKGAISTVDGRLGDLFPHLAEKGYGIMILADHGAHQSEDGRATHDGTTEDDVIVPLAWSSNEHLVISLQ